MVVITILINTYNPFIDGISLLNGDLLTGVMETSYDQWDDPPSRNRSRSPAPPMAIPLLLLQLSLAH